MMMIRTVKQTNDKNDAASPTTTVATTRTGKGPRRWCRPKIFFTCVPVALIAFVLSFVRIKILPSPSSSSSSSQEFHISVSFDSNTALGGGVETQQHPIIPTNNGLHNESMSSNKVIYPGGVEPRAFPPWNETERGHPLPCFDWPKRNQPRSQGLQPPMNRGFLFLKPMKVGGSTAAGIQLRYTHRLARKLGISRHRSRIQQPYNCRGRWDHGQAHAVHPDRQWSKSFLWTLVRHPSKRAVSEFFHFQVSKKHVPPTRDNFVRYIMNRPYMQDFYPYFLTTNQNLLERFQENRSPHNAKTIIHQIGWVDYDFIGVTERMEETAVAFMMLLNGTISDILYLNAKKQGSYDAQCNIVQPANLTVDMQAFLQSKQWQDKIQWDQAIFDWANQSLDKTIQGLNATQFAENLKLFRRAQIVISQECGDLDVFPCSRDGRLNRNHSDCLWRDSGCGYECINRVTVRLGLDQEDESGQNINNMALGREDGQGSGNNNPVVDETDNTYYDDDEIDDGDDDDDDDDKEGNDDDEDDYSNGR